LLIVGFSQIFKISEIDFNKNGKKYVELLGLKEHNTLVARLAYLRLPNMEQKSDYVVYYKTRKRERYKISESVKPLAPSKVKKIRIKKKHFSAYWQFLISHIQDRKLNINQSQLEAIEEMLIFGNRKYLKGKHIALGYIKA
jgi:hypothetical protein